MASVIQIKDTGRWRALVRKKGHETMCKTFGDEKSAKDWAEGIEKAMRPVAADFIETAKTVSMRPIVGIYFLIYSQQIVYVGQSKNIAQRVQSHSQRILFDSYKYKECEVSELDALEDHLIKTLRPKFNIAKKNSLKKILPSFPDQLFRLTTQKTDTKQH